MTINVSVLIPAYNAEATIKRAIESVPERDDTEIIVYDDGSTDNTPEVVKEMIHDGGRIGLLIGEENKGVSHAVNQLLDMASGEYVVLLGSDDWFLPDAFNEVADMLKGNIDLVYFDLEINDGTIFRLNPETKGGYCGSTKFMKRKFGGDTRCAENRRAGEDYFFYRALLEKHPTEAYTHQVVKHYNYPREGSLSWKQAHGEFKPEEL